MKTTATPDSIALVAQSQALAELLARVSLEASRGDTPAQVLERIVGCITDRLPIAVASIILLNEAGTHFVKEVVAGEMDLLPPSDGQWPVTLGAAGRCARTGEAQLIVDVHADPDYIAGNLAVQSEYLVPIRHRERLLGVLNLESPDALFFTPEVRAIFDAVASQVAGTIHLAQVVQELEEANSRLQQLSLRDGLTGIANRRCFDDALDLAWQAHARSEKCLALLMLDVDHFKLLNDTRGHVHADTCLRKLAQKCESFAQRRNDLAARYGGEEFALLLTHCPQAEATDAAETLRADVQALGLAHPNSPVADCVTVSIGVAALCPRPGQSPRLLVEHADQALYQAKRDGRNRVVAAVH